ALFDLQIDCADWNDILARHIVNAIYEAGGNAGANWDARAIWLNVISTYLAQDGVSTSQTYMPSAGKVYTTRKVFSGMTAFAVLQKLCSDSGYVGFLLDDATHCVFADPTIFASGAPI